MKPYPSFEVFDRVFTYNPETGDITNRIKRGRCIVVGKSAVVKTGVKGYFAVTLGRKTFRAHRVAWMLHYKVDNPQCDIDHINGNRGDNRIANLRLACRAENRWNSRLGGRNRSGMKGVMVRKHRSGNVFWQAQVTRHGVVYKSNHTTLDSAVDAVRQMRERLHGEYACHG